MRSDSVKTGTQQAPHRSLFNALGYTEEERRRPMIGIVSSYNEIVPGHMNLDKIVEAVKLGVAMAGGVPRVFPAIAVCDGIAMGHIGMKYSLVTRDLIADSTEAMALAHQFDALVMIPNCDKNVPGLLMAAARVNVPTVFVSGGPMLAGHVKGHKTSLSSMFEAVGSYAAGTMTLEEVEEFETYEEPEEVETFETYEEAGIMTEAEITAEEKEEVTEVEIFDEFWSEPDKTPEEEPQEVPLQLTENLVTETKAYSNAELEKIDELFKSLGLDDDTKGDAR